MIVPTRDYIIDIIQLALRKSQTASTLDIFKNAVSEFILAGFGEDTTHELDVKMAEMVAVAIFARREELAKVLTELVFR